MKKRVLSILLAIVMVAGLFPVTAGATTAEPVTTWNIGAPESGYTATDAVVAKLYTNAADSSKYDLVISGQGEMASTSGTKMPWNTTNSTYKDKIVSVTVESGVTNIESYAFKDCTALTSLTLAATVTNIEDFAFAGCTALTSLTLGSGVTEIGGYAFDGCTSLTSITIPASTTSIALSSFGGCTSLTAYAVESGNTAYSAADGILFKDGGTTLVSYPSNKNDTSYTVPDSVTTISSNAFCYVTNLTELTIPHTTTTIRGAIFYDKVVEGKITINGHTGSAAEAYTKEDTDNTTFVSICNDGDDADTLCDVCNYDPDAHTDHPACGVSCGHDAAHSNVTWTAWTKTNSKTAGNYYLTADVDLQDGTWEFPESGTVNLCLNSFTLDLGETEGIVVNPGVTLNICDCSEGGTGVMTGGKTPTTNGGTVNVYGGKLQYNGSSPVVENYGAFNLYGGAVENVYTGTGMGIKNCVDEENSLTGNVNIYGGSVSAVYYPIVNDGTMTISGGTVSATNENGLCIENDGTLTVSGGTISSPNCGIENSGTLIVSGSAQISSAGIFNAGTQSSLTVTGGTISNVISHQGGSLTVSGGTIDAIDSMTSFTLSGAPTISGMSVEGIGTVGIFLNHGCTLTVGEGGLSNTTPYSVATAATPTESTPVTIVAANETDYSAKFKPVDTENYRAYYDSADKCVKLGSIGDTNIYVAGKHLQGGVYYKYAGGVFSEGNASDYNVYAEKTQDYTYTLKINNLVVTHEKPIYAKVDLTLEVLGINTLTGSESANASDIAGIFVNDSTLTITGSGTLNVSGGNNTKTGTTYSSGIYSHHKLTINMTGALNATGGSAASGSYGIQGADEVEIISGTVTATGGAAKNSYGLFSSHELTISGGTVTGNGGTATDTSSGIRVNNSYDLIISGGTVKGTGGSATNSYGIDHDDSKPITLTGGTIEAKSGAGTTAAQAIHAKSGNVGFGTENSKWYKWTTTEGGTLTPASTTEYSYSTNGSATYVKFVPDAITISGTLTISGTPVVGETLTATYTGGATGETFGYVWYRGSGSTDITGGANSQTYTLTQADIGQKIQAGVVGTGSYTGFKLSNELGPVTYTITGSVEVSGEAKFGQTLTATYTGSETVSYQWYRGEDAITGATSSTYTLAADDVGETIKVVVSGSGNYSGSVTSATTAAVAKATPGYSAPTAISGLKYTGEAQSLVNAGSATGGTMYYALGGTNNPTGTWSTDVPTGTDVKTYYVWYKVVGNTGYEDVAQTYVSVSIGKADAATTPTSSCYSIDYSAEILTFDSGYEVYTAQQDGTNISTGSSIADYVGQTVYIRTRATLTHNASEWVDIEIAARPAAPTGVTVTNETVSGQGDGSVTGITAEMEYKIGTGEWTSGPSDLSNLAAGTQITVRVKATATAPHGVESSYTVSAGNTLTVTFDAQSGSAVDPVAGLSYNAAIIELPETTRTGYDFGGWWTEENGGGTQLTTSTQITADITYYAKWTPAELTGTVTIGGTLQVGQTLTAVVDGSNNTGEFSYQWVRAAETNSAIDGATRSTYTLTADDVGCKIYCVVSSSIQTGTVTSATTAAIAKLNAPAAPTGLTVNAPSAPEVNDGKITGVSIAMEYSTDGINWTSCTGTEVTGLGSGTYYVRIAETGDTDAGASITIVVPAVYTVTFNANGGSEVAPVYVVHENKVAKPTDPVRSSYTFAGWYTAAEGGVQYDFNAAVTEDTTLYARWSSEPVYDITGEVKQAQQDGDPVPAIGVTVTLRQGNTILFTKTTDAEGKYDFHAPAGTYNIVAVSGEKTMTQLITVTDHDEQAATIVLPYQNVSSELTIPVGTPDIVVGGLDEEVVETNPNATSSETHITLSMTVEQKEDMTSNEAPENAELKAEQTAIKTEAGSQKENLTFFTIDLSKITTTNQVDGEPEKVTSTTKLLEIIIPFETSGRQSFKVYRHHGSDVDVLTTTVNGDGEYIEVGEDEITIHARKFSTYAIGYSEPAPYYPPVIIVHTCTSKCDVCGGCEDAKCTQSACKDKCLLLGMNFTDVAEGKWYTEPVKYVYHHKMMEGVGNDLFDINGTTTRAMIVTILWRLEGEPVVNYLMQFEDVPTEIWYTEAVRWAASEKIVEGYSDTAFGPTDPITREQLATILYRYEQYKGGGFTGAWMFLLDYTDRDKVSDWAYEAMCWTTMHGVINGKGDGILDPKGNAKRCEAAQMLMNYLNK